MRPLMLVGHCTDSYQSRTRTGHMPKCMPVSIEATLIINDQTTALSHNTNREANLS